MIVVELIYAFLFYLLFRNYIRQQQKRIGREAARRHGVVLLVVHTLCLIALVFIIPDFYMPSLVRLLIVLPVVCRRDLYVLR